MKKPTEVQAECIPAILAGRHVLGAAETGSGKTAAFALPIIRKLSDDPFGIYALVLTPTRELGIQIHQQFTSLGAGMKLRCALVVGGMDIIEQSLQLSRKPHVVVATPGRLAEILSSSTDILLNKLRVLVLDEADRLLEGNYVEHLGVILEKCRKNRQNLLFSATIPPSLLGWCEASDLNPFIFASKAENKVNTRITQEYCFIPQRVKEAYLYAILRTFLEDSPKEALALVFASTVASCQFIAFLCDCLGIPCVALHSGLSQGRRAAALASFRAQTVRILICTDVAARGLDIPSVQLIVHYYAPASSASYIHRCGRAAREMGSSGRSILLLAPDEVARLQLLEEEAECKVASCESVEEEEVLQTLTRVSRACREAEERMKETEGAQWHRPKRKGPSAGDKKRNQAAANSADPADPASPALGSKKSKKVKKSK